MKTRVLKNLVGDVLGYARCPVTRDTYWNTNIVSVPYSKSCGVLVSARALKEVPREKIAKAVFDKSREFPVKPFIPRFSLEEITNAIPEGCMNLPAS